ncbi:MAG: winged helix-turn-helix transcriptional regulator [Candidatus Magasanikbacteria bacterium]|nr:winged helix-turn-helix transcriptional regulator [Candidatus Magasanikbacteria bacterium]
MNTAILKKLGFSDKEMAVYLTLLVLGPSSVRAIAVKANVNRGTTYDILRDLIKQGIVSYYQKEAKQYFVAEDPGKLTAVTEDRIQKLRELAEPLKDLIPELKALQKTGGEKPTARFFEGTAGVKIMLVDLLETVAASQDKTYYSFSSSNIRAFVRDAYPDFTEDRIKRGVKVKVIAVGEGGEMKGLDERKFLKLEGSPTYIFLYADKCAYVSLDAAKQLVTVIIENEGLYQSQKTIFEELWKRI